MLRGKINLTYHCGHAYQWAFDDLQDASKHTDRCPICIDPALEDEEVDLFGEV